MPYQITLCILAFICIIGLNSCLAQPDKNPEKERFQVQLSTYKELVHKTYFKDAGLEDVKHFKDGNGFNRYYLGFFESKEEAETNLKKAENQGFKNAKILSTKEDEIAKIIDAQATPHKYYEVTYDELFLRTVHFDSNSSRLDDPAQQLLHEVYIIMVRNPNWVVQLSGHSDSIGSPEYNVKLSKNRVRSVKKHLSSYGIQDARIKTRVFGEAAPIAKNREKTGEDVPSGRQLNRRVCIGIYNENGEMVNIKNSTIVPFDAEIGN